jgi:hypothetical protein
MPVAFARGMRRNAFLLVLSLALLTACRPNPVPVPTPEPEPAPTPEPDRPIDPQDTLAEVSEQLMRV